MSDEYIKRDGTLGHAVNKLTPKRELELREHLRTCETSMVVCDDCMELAENIGYDKYIDYLLEDTEDE